MRTYYLRSFGCQMNDHDAERIRALLEVEGLRRVSSPDEADVLVYNTCTVRASAEERFAGHLGHATRLKRDDPHRLVVVTGCLPQAEREDFFARYPCVDVAIGPQNLDRLPIVLACEGSVALGLFADRPRFSGDLPSRRERPFQAWVQVMSGCTNFCSYCIVPVVRGPERSRSVASIVREVEGLALEGVKEITLLGQNVNAYGRDLHNGRPGPSFAQLLERLDLVPGIARIRFTTSHPKDLGDDLVAAVATLPRVCEHVHLPVQSGSDSVLARMRRGYTAAAYLERAARLREAVEDVAITTDLIVGFPGETEDDFAATLDLVRAAGFEAAFTFVFSPRAGTAAAELPGQVDEDVKRERMQRLVALTQAQALARNDAFVGRRVEVLVEGPSRHGGGLRGRTRQHVTVNFSGPAEPGSLVPIVVTGATSTTLRGHV